MLIENNAVSSWRSGVIDLKEPHGLLKAFHLDFAEVAEAEGLATGEDGPSVSDRRVSPHPNPLPRERELGNVPFSNGPNRGRRAWKASATGGLELRVVRVSRWA